MSSLVPNLDDLVAALPAEGPGVQLATAFEVGDLDEVRRALRSVVENWESESDGLHQEVVPNDAPEATP